MEQAYKKHGKLAIIICLAILSILYMITNKSSDYEFSAKTIDEEVEGEALGEEEKVEEKIIQKVPVYVCGQVRTPDVYYLYETDIIQEAIMAAGGFTVHANKEIWNLAMAIERGMKIYVPKLGEEIDKTHDSYDNRMRDDYALNSKSQMLNINQADVQELTTLSGIGPVLAQNIIDFRTSNGDFETLEDVNNVPRIGKVTLEKIKDHICFQ